MNRIIARLPLLVGNALNQALGEIQITAPTLEQDGKFTCEVRFKGAEKFSRKIQGDDEIHALECTLAYLNGIRNNSKDPEFFWPNGDTMFIDRDG